eukprot:scaffold13330_cov205-Alexandrium_tamarense.AAC.7
MPKHRGLRSKSKGAAYRLTGGKKDRATDRLYASSVLVEIVPEEDKEAEGCASVIKDILWWNYGLEAIVTTDNGNGDVTVHVEKKADCESVLLDVLDALAGDENYSRQFAEATGEVALDGVYTDLGLSDKFKKEKECKDDCSVFTGKKLNDICEDKCKCMDDCDGELDEKECAKDCEKDCEHDCSRELDWKDFCKKDVCDMKL